MLPETGPRKRLISILALGAAAALVAILVARSRAPSSGAGAAAPSFSASSSGAPPQSASATTRPGAKGRVTVGVYDEGQPMPDRVVVFQDADGNVVSSAKTGADGKASAELWAGDMVTVAQGTSLRQMFTIVGVQPGDELVVGEPVDEESVAAAAGSAKVKLPGRHAGAARYVVNLGVGATETIDPAVPVPLPVLDRFLVDGKKFKALAEALDDAGEPLAFAFAWAPWDEAKTKTHADVDVRLAPWSTKFQTFEIALSNSPAEAMSVDAKLTIFSKDEDRFERKPRRAELHEKTTIRFPVPPQLGSEAQYRLDFSYGGSPDKSVLVRREETMAAKQTVDLGTALLPRVSGAAIEPTDTVARPEVRWNVSGDAARADVMLVRVAWPATREHLWTIVLPPTAPTRFRLPALPKELDSWAPDRRPMTAAAALVEASFYASFAEVRRKGLWLTSEPPEDAKGGVTLRYSATGDLEL